MIYLTGSWGAGEILELLDRNTLGALVTSRHRKVEPARLTRWTWAMDNECYALGDAFDPEDYRKLLADFAGIPGCRFATAPDVVGDWQATLERAGEWLPAIRAAGFPAAFVLQDGQPVDRVPWPELDAVFVGGTDDFKESAAVRELVREAKWRGKWAHCGRVNSYRRFAIMVEFGCDSADGTFLRFAPSGNIPRVEMWLRRARADDMQLSLFAPNPDAYAAEA